MTVHRSEQITVHTTPARLRALADRLEHNWSRRDVYKPPICAWRHGEMQIWIGHDVDACRAELIAANGDKA